MSELQTWTRRGTRTLYQSAHVVVREDALQLPDGREKAYPVMALGSSVGILPLLSDGRVILVRQYRHITRDFSWEIPGGGMLADEPPEDAAQRELREESGYRAGRLQRLGKFWPNNAYLDEVIHVYVALDLVTDPLPADQDEHLEIRAFPFDEVLAMALDDRITCGLTKLAILWAAVARCDRDKT
ncbi:MAG TPA: NUDIX hydrolase [Candidatus Acidoferrum sp.]|nr:NUDIX hydrolase [Candidatus Methylomirabilis sp.]HWU41289.1 NUDIX hydrolase [Candidatus Acidoferrum sp.]